MADLQKVFDTYTALSDASLLKTARQNLAVALKHLHKYREGEESELLSAIIAAALGADGELSDREIAFMSELLSRDFSGDALARLTARFDNSAMREAVDRVTDSMDQEGKRALCALCLCILASDRTVSPKENAFFLQLMK